MKNVFSFILVIGLFSCGPNADTHKLNNMVQKIEAEKLTDAEWDKYQSEIEALIEKHKLEEKNLTPEQTKEWNSLVGKYRAQQVKRGLNKLKLEMQNLGEQADSFMEELTK